MLNCLGEGEYNATMKHFLQVRRCRLPVLPHALLPERLATAGPGYTHGHTRPHSPPAGPQRFPPGADRFEGIEWSPAKGNGCPVIGASIAHMECVIRSRLETPDHWVVYAEVVEGEVAQPQKKTAVHRRVVANYYVRRGWRCAWQCA